ncbi:MAG: hypothetical protein HYZ37_15135 [Candidatus Solibacter usitatus]|nr:hypothetical protein [Candidatus Solibacter usitatus]
MKRTASSNEAVRKKPPVREEGSWRLPSGTGLGEFALQTGMLASHLLREGTSLEEKHPARKSTRRGKTRPVLTEVE